ncbi:MAG: hypothetical protein HOB47_05660 [Euryarchaeota archaeon]|nr:hypothetical protein [Euryarchaeota archaeon]
MGESEDAEWPEDDSELFDDKTPSPDSKEEGLESSESSDERLEENTEAEAEEQAEEQAENGLEEPNQVATDTDGWGLPIRAAPLLLQFQNETVTEYPLQQSKDGRKTTSLVFDEDLLRIIESRFDDDGQRRLKVSLSMKREITGFKHQHNELMHKHQFLWLSSAIFGAVCLLSSSSVFNLIGLVLITIGGWNWTKMHLETHHLEFSNSGGTLSHTLRGYGTNRPFFRISMALLGSEMAGLLRNGLLETEAVNQLHAELEAPAPLPAPTPIPVPVQQPHPVAVEQHVTVSPQPVAPKHIPPVSSPQQLPLQPNPPENTPMPGPPIVQIPPPPTSLPAPLPAPLPPPTLLPPLGVNDSMSLPPPLGLPVAPLPLDAPLPNAPEIAVAASPVEEVLSEKEQNDLLSELS